MLGSGSQTASVRPNNCLIADGAHEIRPIGCSCKVRKPTSPQPTTDVSYMMTLNILTILGLGSNHRSSNIDVRVKPEELEHRCKGQMRGART